MAVLLSVVFVLLVYPVHVTGQTLCDTDGMLELVENTTDNMFTCTGFDSGHTITWIVIQSGGAEATLSQCSDNMVCTDNYKPYLTASRSAEDTSTLTLDGSNKSFSIVQGQTIICKRQLNTDSQKTQCQVDVVAIPSVTCDAHYNTGTSSPWTVTVNCSVSGAYSYLNRYTCQLVQASPSTKNLGSVNMTVTSTTSGKYKSGTCDVTVSFPDVTDVYSYKMVVTPGRKNVNVMFGGQSSFTIRRPSTHPSHTCPQYVQESQGASCTCTATDLGQPPGVVRWTSTGTNQLSLSNVNRNQEGTEYTCEIMWSRQRVQSVKYTVQVAYGPSSVSISQPPSPFDTDGQQQLTLTCSSDGNPAPTFTWHKGSNSNIIGQGNTYMFTPQPSDDNSMFVCQAANTATGASQQDTVTLTLNYPPTGNPVITKSTASGSQGHLYQGDRVTLTCSVTGGKPFHATKVTFTCPGKQDRPDSVGSSGVSSTVTFDTLTAADHNEVCTCTTRWKNKNWYNKNENITLFVNSPPSTPVIRKPSNYPFITTVTQAATLTCHSTTPGVPASTYTWPVTQGGQEGTDVQGRGTLTFDTVSKELNGKNVSCRASNRFTDNRQRVPDGELMLEIYYQPEIIIEPVEDTDPNQCDIRSSDKSQCVVMKGHRVHFRCSASSNPSPQHITWQGTSEMNPDLLIESANHQQHTGVYNCSVTTGRGNHGNDNRLPLKGVKSFTVLVTYPPLISSFEVNSSTTLMVNASDVLDLSCHAVGLPPPQMKLIHPNTNLIPVTSQGSTSDDTSSVVSGKLIAQCRDTGIYTCNVDNIVGSAQQQVSILVQCGPKALTGSDDGQSRQVNFGSEAVQLTFKVTAYPPPKLEEVNFFKQQPDGTTVGQAVEKGTVGVKCVPDSNVSANVTCHITVDNMKSANAGFYQVVVSNDFGELIINFEVKVNAGSDFPVAAVVGGILAALVVAAVVIIVVVLVLRRRKGKKQKPASSSSQRDKNREEPRMIVNTIYGTSGEDDNGDDFMITNNFYESSESAAPKRNQPGTIQVSPYEDVDVPNAKPVIMPKPKSQPGASAAEVNSTGDVYATVNKGNVSQPDPQENADVYAIVNKQKTEPAAPVASKDEKTKPGKKMAPKKPKKEKGKKPAKKEDKQALDSAQDTSCAPKRNQPGTIQVSPYEDVDVPNAKPVVMPKPKSQPGASAAEVNSTGDVYATVNKGNVSHPGPQENADMYAIVNKQKTEPATPVASKDEKTKPGKKMAPKKPKKEKGKKPAKKEDKQVLDPAQDTSSGAIYGNMNMTPLSMHPPPEPEGSVYENYAFQKDDSTETNHEPDLEPEDCRTVNADGLVYTTVAFTKRQLEKEQQPAPEREMTEYVGIDFSKMMSS